MCIANDTLIAIPDGYKPIYMIAKGEQVLVASVRSNSDKIQMNWSTAKVNYNDGNPSGGEPAVAYIFLRGKETNELICSTGQPFLLADGKYTMAGSLHSGQQLVDKDGDPVTIEVRIGHSYYGGVHHISTGNPWYKSPDGHLLLVGGVVAGDHTLQIYFDQIPDSMKEDN